eukprot:gb/GFBE01018792.1/.p1 GENE.gb/GFBE01018792.1/~~gb/GFBE01018792.1/.p1  ORF type:complete len:254 (+),score=53.46 gb/GFBE01018792.1/:1-762(+)
MAFARDHGTCCVVLPLKLGVSFVAMLVWFDAILCTVATFTGDIRFQPNGYNQAFYRVPTFVGVPGIFIGFIGILGIYDDKPEWVRWLVYFLFVKLAALVTASVADYWTLRKCDSWLSSTEHLTTENEQLTVLAEAEVCPWARLAYLVGSSIIILFWAYCTHHTYYYMQQIEANPGYQIDFGIEKHDTKGRWDFYQVKDPRLSQEEENQPLLPQLHATDEETEHAGYGSAPNFNSATGYGPDGQQARNSEMIDF